MLNRDIVRCNEEENPKGHYKSIAKKSSLQKYWLYWLILGIIFEIINYLFIIL